MQITCGFYFSRLVVGNKRRALKLHNFCILSSQLQHLDVALCWAGAVDNNKFIFNPRGGSVAVRFHLAVKNLFYNNYLRVHLLIPLCRWLQQQQQQHQRPRYGRRVTLVAHGSSGYYYYVVIVDVLPIGCSGRGAAAVGTFISCPA